MHLLVKFFFVISLISTANLAFAQTTIHWTSQQADLTLPNAQEHTLTSVEGHLIATSPQHNQITKAWITNEQWQSQQFELQSFDKVLNSIAYQDSLIAIEKSDSEQENRVSLLNFKDNQLQETLLATLPIKVNTASLSIIDNSLYLLATITGEANRFYSLDLTDDNTTGHWSPLPAPQQSNTAFVSAVQNDGKGMKLFALADNFLLWQFNPEHEQWQQMPPLALSDRKASIKSFNVIGQSHILASTNDGSGATYNAITKQWSEYQTKGYDTTTALSSNLVAHGEQFIAIDNSKNKPAFWQVSVVSGGKNFGWINMTVLIVYLLLVVLVGVYFMFKNRNTDDYFRGGQDIPWWAAACSIYATMLSSLTYVALPAIVYQTNWLLLVGTWMIILVAPVAIYIAMPFFRQIDATSAYEYLSKRFNMSVRLFASALFTLFHIGRMGIVMALTALALAAVTPLTAGESVLLMGVLCLIYCTLGGIEAVIWTDTLQTVVLLIGAVLCFITIINGIDGGLSTYIDVATANDKMTIINADFGSDSMLTLSLWVIVIGGIGQNLSSYTADQAVVQRYMVTSDVNAAKKSIWANALIAGPSALLFFAIGTGLYVFYSGQPEKLDPNMRIDQIFPSFIATELPVGIAGLIVAGIFAAAQSTVSTSMNSIATTLVTDFVRPFKLVQTEAGYMSAARWLTFLMGALGTLAGLIFIDPEIRSLMNAYFKVIGMFMGALGGLFVLGVLSKRANAMGAMIGILSGVAMMLWAWQSGWANGYLYATIGIVSCLVIGYIASLLNPNTKDISGLTLSTMKK